MDPDAADYGDGDREHRFSWPPSAGKDPKELSLVYACRMRRKDVIEFLLGRGGDIDAAPVNQETGLHWTAFYQSNSIVPLLLERGANPAVTNHEGQTLEELGRDSGNKRGADLLAAASA